MKVAVVGTDCLLTENNRDDMKAVLEDAIENAFTITTLFPIGFSKDFVQWTVDWAAANGETVNDLLQYETQLVNGNVPKIVKQQIKNNKTNLALISIWDGGSRPIGDLVQFCKSEGIAQYSTNGRWVFST